MGVGMRRPHLSIFKSDKDQQWYLIGRAGNGQTTDLSEGHPRLSDAKRAARRRIKRPPTFFIVEPVPKQTRTVKQSKRRTPRR